MCSPALMLALVSPDLLDEISATFVFNMLISPTSCILKALPILGKGIILGKYEPLQCTDFLHTQTLTFSELAAVGKWGATPVTPSVGFQGHLSG